MFKKRSKAFFTSTILATAYLIYIVSYFNGILGKGDDAEQIGSGIATALVTPHMVILGIGVIFGWIAFGMTRSGFALVSSILYSVAGLMFIPYLMFLVPSIILGFIGYSKQKNINKQVNENSNNNLKA